jgi:hypothetical protein
MNVPLSYRFNNIGYLRHKFQEDELSFLREEVYGIKANFSAPENIPFNNTLAGNIQHEYSLTKSLEKLEKLLFPYFNIFNRECNLLKSVAYATHSVPINLGSSWVNFQKKTEFNPIHNHSGIASFIIYLDVPYFIEDEKRNISSINSSVNVPAHFCFLYTDSLGQINCESIPVDKTFRNVLLMFPSKMMHCVYPFYTSDEYRISVSGNFYLNTDTTNCQKINGE